MQERHSNRERYFEEQARTTERYYIPYIRRFVRAIPDEVLEVGCGEGGNLMPFARMGCRVTGVDMAAPRVEQAKTFFAERGQEGTFIAADIFQLKELERKFSLILVHDVIEHIGDKERFLRGLRRYLAPDGVIFIAFPAWQMPFGGHQQIARGKASRLPFIHLLPAGLYARLLRRLGEGEATVRELLEIKETRCPIELFRSVVRRASYRIVDQQLYFINPHYEVKFGLKPRKLNGLIASIPYARNFFSTSCFYIIRPLTIGNPFAVG